MAMPIARVMNGSRLPRECHESSFAPETTAEGQATETEEGQLTYTEVRCHSDCHARSRHLMSEPLVLESHQNAHEQE
eukprot:CAMPEP_0177182182 /NCGR_PEP_ID=MMETSP0367-20130122/16336_1 /TAXON_ID=447022 ORGANISM="Scrippsiella hangoei-like, Strain SHHI-4" /NCGR_SAMPLE_ID=MMETSP0367 /ASSEMBLY_ACC=CAM_ASM_000362 /LENGTH=76 /DNA_ID=CAMNT_0018629111 /DNA_START=370 /DNA_END=600 /DNA_ORIENTATION=+